MNNRLFRFVATMALAAIAGCATPEQRAEAMAGYISENYAPACTRLGYVAGTDSHRDCMLSLYNADQVRFATPWPIPPAPVYRRR